MEKLHWNSSEVISYLEMKISDDIATDREVEFYEDFIWKGNGKLDKKKFFNTYKKLMRELKRYYDGN